MRSEPHPHENVKEAHKFATAPLSFKAVDSFLYAIAEICQTNYSRKKKEIRESMKKKEGLS
ncbi:hypothetical protein [Paenibacillus sp. NEAU-GSW1]|uniref:hypothetical protein n=1 Tax=Paenibacillus sp. NEAU-GSW1 TaxID=2682486 RepID=UPI0012E0E5A4|nr:hypothetical protein [Paenibacillus sp. NEAU-GSW1]MUT64898.1 hypothetical protein [Paenibacillus sp. NEAU-GSW1]